MSDKVLIAQQAGAIGVLIADDGKCQFFIGAFYYIFICLMSVAYIGTCGDEFINCGPRAGSVSQGGFAPYDSTTTWQSLIKIPVLFVSLNTANRYIKISSYVKHTIFTLVNDRLRQAMAIKRVAVPPFGWQNVSSISLLEDSEL